MTMKMNRMMKKTMNVSNHVLSQKNSRFPFLVGGFKRRKVQDQSTDDDEDEDDDDDDDD